VTVQSGLGRINVAMKDRIYGTRGNYGVSFQYGVSAWGDFALSLEPGQEGTLLWNNDYSEPPITNATVILGPMSLEDKVYTVIIKETRQWYGYNLDTGKKIWGPTDPQSDFDVYSSRSSSWGTIAYGRLYSIGYAGILYAYDIKNGSLLWQSPLNPTGLESAYPYWPSGSGSGVSIADHKVYITTGEHSTDEPLYRGWSIYCFDADSGKNLWNFTGLMPRLAIADGYAVSLDAMDNQIYCFGKGQTATTIMASPDVSKFGDSVLIKGTVTDQSPGAKDTPAIADRYMSEWMEYLYHQRQMPTAAGVEVVLETLDPNGNFYEIGNATSDANGMYSYPFTPEVPGLYTIIASFKGSNSYFSSVAETAINVEEIHEVAPTPTPPPEPTGMYILGSTIGIIIAIAVVGLVLMLMLRKR
jgi:outer membrane protein assembly factor BamB